MPRRPFILLALVAFAAVAAFALLTTPAPAVPVTPLAALAFAVLAIGALVHPAPGHLGEAAAMAAIVFMLFVAEALTCPPGPERVALMAGLIVLGGALAAHEGHTRRSETASVIHHRRPLSG